MISSYHRSVPSTSTFHWASVPQQDKPFVPQMNSPRVRLWVRKTQLGVNPAPLWAFSFLVHSCFFVFFHEQCMSLGGIAMGFFLEPLQPLLAPGRKAESSEREHRGSCCTSPVQSQCPLAELISELNTWVMTLEKSSTRE